LCKKSCQENSLLTAPAPDFAELQTKCTDALSAAALSSAMYQLPVHNKAMWAWKICELEYPAHPDPAVVDAQKSITSGWGSIDKEPIEDDDEEPREDRRVSKTVIEDESEDEDDDEEPGEDRRVSKTVVEDESEEPDEDDCERSIRAIDNAVMDRIEVFFGPACGLTKEHVLVTADGKNIKTEESLVLLGNPSCQGHPLLKKIISNFGQLEKRCSDEKSQNHIKTASKSGLAFLTNIVKLWLRCQTTPMLCRAKASSASKQASGSTADLPADEAPVARPTKVVPTPTGVVGQLKLAASLVNVLSNKMTYQDDKADPETGLTKPEVDCKKLMQTFEIFAQGRTYITRATVRTTLAALSEDQFDNAKRAFWKAHKQEEMDSVSGHVTFNTIAHMTFSMDDEMECKQQHAIATR